MISLYELDCSIIIIYVSFDFVLLQYHSMQSTRALFKLQAGPLINAVISITLSGCIIVVYNDEFVWGNS